MEKVLTELALYDVMAYLIPGLVVIAACIALFNTIRDYGYWKWSWSAVVVAYLVGHLVQALASPMRDWAQPPLYKVDMASVYGDDKINRKEFRDDLFRRLHDAFPSARHSEEAFTLAESYIQDRGKDSFAQIMQARYGFFRGLTLSFIFAVPLLTLAALLKLRGGRGLVEAVEPGGVAVLCVAAAVISYGRTSDFERYHVEAVYRAFYVNYVLPGDNDNAK